MLEVCGEGACYLFFHVSTGLGFTVGELANERLQTMKLFKQSRLNTRFPQLQVKGAAGQDEWRVVVKVLQDVRCR